MKKSIVCSTLLLFVLFLLGTPANAQKRIASPRDSVSGKVGNTSVHINYGSPSVKGRKIWGGLVPYGEVWRAGANEATTVTLGGPVTIDGKTLPAGTYAFFVIPAEKEWTVIFNKTANQWGAYDYNKKEDAMRFQVLPARATSFSERLIYVITATGFSLRWENKEVPVSFGK